MSVSGHPEAVVTWSKHAKDQIHDLVLRFYEPIFAKCQNAPPANPTARVYTPKETDQYDHLVEEAYRALPPTYRYILDVCGFIEAVDNGGIDQFFYNSSGDHAIETLNALDLIGSLETVSVLREAIALFAEAGPDRLRQVRQRQLEEVRFSYAATLEQLNNRFYQRREDLYALLLATWRSTNETYPDNH